MFKLIIGEWKKFFSQKIILIVVIILLLLNIGCAAYKYIEQNENDNSFENWRVHLEERNVLLYQSIPELTKGSLMYVNNQKKILLNEYRLINNLPPKNNINVWSFIDFSKITLSFIGLIIIVISSQLISSEFQWKTIKTIMAKPVSRWKFITSKVLTLLSFIFFIILIQLIFTFLLGAILFGFKGETVFLSIQSGQVIQEHYGVVMLRHFFLTALSLFVLGMMALMFSTVFRTTAVAMAISLFLYFTAGNATMILAAYFDWIKYTLFANTDLNMYFNGTVFMNNMSLTFSLIMLGLYLCFFLVVSIGSFVKREI